MSRDTFIGRQLGNYKIVERIGDGGMATVYRAYQTSLNRYVAIKILSPMLAADQALRERFVREARAVAQLRHPHILSVHDFGEDEETGVLYIVMEYADGGSLDQLIGDPMSVEEVIGYLAGIANALDYAHARGIVHRDVKPQNILLNEQTHCMLSDFGIARVMSASTHLTQTGMGVGTPAYMSPEQARGEEVDGRSDQYSFAVMVYKMLSGRLPFSGTTPYLIVNQHISDPPPPLSGMDEPLATRLNMVLFRALSKDPDLRFGTVSEFVEALGAAADDTISDDVLLQKYGYAGAEQTIVPSTLNRARQPIATGRVAVDVPEKDVLVRHVVHPRVDSDLELRTNGEKSRKWWLAGAAFLLMALIIGGLAVWATPASPIDGNQNEKSITESDGLVSTTPASIATSASIPTPILTVTTLPVDTASVIENTKPYSQTKFIADVIYVSFLRSGPSVHSQILETFYTNHEVEILGRYKRWYKVKAETKDNDDIVGWVLGTDLSRPVLDPPTTVSAGGTRATTTRDTKTWQGPDSTMYPQAGELPRGTTVDVVGKFTNSAGELWYQLADGSWIWSIWVTAETPDDIPDIIPAITPTADVISPTPVTSTAATGATFGDPNDIYDDFNNSLYDGSYDHTKWAFWSTPENNFSQKDGVLFLNRNVPGLGTDKCLIARWVTGIQLTEPFMVEARMKLAPETTKGAVSIKIAVDNIGWGPLWTTQCGIYGENVPGWQPWAFCGAGYVRKDGDYSTGKDIHYNTWHSFRIEVDPKGKFVYYIDDVKNGELETRSFSNYRFSLVLCSNAIGYVDDVKYTGPRTVYR